jgi:putative nucleotidyltransferase with HDIG domain
VLRVYEASRRNLSVVSFAGLSDAKAGLLAGFEEDLAQKVLHSGITCVINDLNAHFNGKVPAYLKKNRIKSLIITPLFSAKRRAGVLSMYIPEARFFDKEEISMFEMISSLCSVAIDNSVMLERIRRDYLNMVKTLAKIIDTNDPYTRGHCDKVMKYSLAICRKMRLKNRDLNAVKTASLLHDIGKIGVDLSVIRKSGKLSGEDWESIKTHPDIGARIVAQVGFLNDIVPIIRHHHERYGGGGYPDPKKKREKIPLGARIIAVADAFDAMTSDRPYRKAMTRDRAVRELKACAGSQFDPEVVKAFIG